MFPHFFLSSSYLHSSMTSESRIPPILAFPRMSRSCSKSVTWTASGRPQPSTAASSVDAPRHRGREARLLLLRLGVSFQLLKLLVRPDRLDRPPTPDTNTRVEEMGQYAGKWAPKQASKRTPSRATNNMRENQRGALIFLGCGVVHETCSYLIGVSSYLQSSHRFMILCQHSSKMVFIGDPNVTLSVPKTVDVWTSRV